MEKVFEAKYPKVDVIRTMKFPESTRLYCSVGWQYGGWAKMHCFVGEIAHGPVHPREKTIVTNQ
jgi:hypothetical protein